MENEIKRVKEILKSRGYKMTTQRKAALDVIIKNEGKHMSTEEVYLEIRKNHPEIGLATVYRTMLLLEESGILHKQDFNDGRSRYELNHEEEDHNHHHLICIKCGEVTEVEDDLLEKLEEKIELNHSFKVIDHKVKFLGYCAKCSIQGE